MAGELEGQSLRTEAEGLRDAFVELVSKVDDPPLNHMFSTKTGTFMGFVMLPDGRRWNTFISFSGQEVRTLDARDVNGEGSIKIRVDETPLILHMDSKARRTENNERAIVSARRFIAGPQKLLEAQ